MWYMNLSKGSTNAITIAERKCEFILRMWMFVPYANDSPMCACALVSSCFVN